MRIALVHRDLHTVTRGGIGTVYRALAPRLCAAGHEVVLIAQDSPNPLVLDEARMITLPRTDDLDAHRAAVAQTLRELNPDIVESSSWDAETLGYVRLPRSQRAPVVVRGDLSARTMRAFSHLVSAERELVNSAEKVIAVSDFAADDLAHAYGVTRPPLIANGVDRDRFHPGSVTTPTGGQRITLATDATAATRHPLTDCPLRPPWAHADEGRRRLVWVGKTTPMKGWDRLEHLAHALTDVAHIIVLLGHAPALTPITLTGSEPNVTILQDLPERDLPSFYRAADFLLSTSRWEGFGLAIAEALACGTPALLPADLGTARELLAAGGGHTYRTADDLRTVLTKPCPVGTLPSRFSWDHAASATLAVYRDLREQTEVA